MCELFCLSSRLATRTTFSLCTFASHGAAGAAGGVAVDGWGVALYDGADVRLYKEPEPAGDSAWLKFVEGRRLASRLLLSHIRHATTGAVSFANTQPFVRELGGRRHVFAHNGKLDGIADCFGAAALRFHPVGATDSEMAFCLLLERLVPLWRGPAVPALGDRLDVVARFAAEMRAFGPANFLYADGDALFAHGHRRMQANGTIAPPGLWLLARECAVDADGLMQAGVRVEAGGDGQKIVLLASVPLSGEGWRPLAEGEVIVVKDGRIVGRAADRHPAGSGGKPRTANRRQTA
jgi:predicted glutamine amidotransferase